MKCFHLMMENNSTRWKKNAFQNYLQIDGNFLMLFHMEWIFFSNLNSVVSLNVLSINKRDFLSQINIIQPGVFSQFALKLNLSRTEKKNRFKPRNIGKFSHFLSRFSSQKNIKRNIELRLFWVR